MKIIKTASYKKADIMETDTSNLEFRMVVNGKVSSPENFYNNPKHLVKADYIELFLLDKTKLLNKNDKEYFEIYNDYKKEKYPAIGEIMLIRLKDFKEKYFYSTGSKSKKGYGPILYDKAVYILSRIGYKLINHSAAYFLLNHKQHEMMTSPSAKKVWNTYRDDRYDVQKHPIENSPYFAISKDPNQKYFYEN